MTISKEVKLWSPLYMAINLDKDGKPTFRVEMMDAFNGVNGEGPTLKKAIAKMVDNAKKPPVVEG